MSKSLKIFSSFMTVAPGLKFEHFTLCITLIACSLIMNKHFTDVYSVPIVQSDVMISTMPSTAHVWWSKAEEHIQSTCVPNYQQNLTRK